MSVAAIKDRLKTIQETITGIQRAYDNGPKGLPPSDLPCFVNFTGPATDDWRALGSDHDVETRLYVMRLYVRPDTSGIDGEAEAACEPFFPLVRDTFASRPMLGLGQINTGLAGVDAVFLGDQGTQLLRYDGVDYIGVEFRLQVSETVRRRYAAGE